MTHLRRRILLLLSAVAVAMLGVAWWIRQQELLPSFLELERNQALADLQRGTEALRNEIQFVSDYVSDWSGWDDTYRFVLDRNSEFAASNLETDVFRDTSFDYLSLIGLEGEEVWRGAQLDGESIELPSLPSGNWPVDHPLLAARELDGVTSGLLVTMHGPLLVAARPITDSARTAPMRGWIVMGRFLTTRRIQKLRNQTRLDVEFIEASAASALQRGEPLGDGEQAPRLRIDQRELHVSTVLRGLRGSEDDLVVEVRSPRSIMAHGSRALDFATWATMGSVLALFGVIGFVLQRSVVSPLQSLTKHALRIRDTGDLTGGSGIDRTDELGVLAREFDAMVAKLSELQAVQVEQARAAGMAEVARSVLHDVGNALQPVQGSVSTLKRQTRSRSAADLERVGELMRAKGDDLSRWIAEDRQGRQLPTFLGVLSKSLRSEHEAMSQEVDLLAKCIDHIQNLVDRQNVHRTAATAREYVKAEALVAQALRMSSAPIDDGVVVEPDVQLDETLFLERHKLLAVLINLLRNARHASRGVPVDRRRIRIRVEAADGDRVRFVVEDQGIGLAAEDLTRVFRGKQSGSVHAQGQGLGLHGCANSIAEMGGRLWAESDGLGRGARFVIEIPALHRTAGTPTPVEAAGAAT